jgi:23S rRNA (adenine2503-C2)-methyltransferase
LLVPDPSPVPLPNPLGLTAAEFCRAYAGVHGGAIAAYRRLFREGVTEQKGVAVQIPPIIREQREQSPEGEVIKFVLPLGGTDRRSREREEGDRRIPLETESVLIPMAGRLGQLNYTLCVSSQVGCAMGCTFCETAQMGLIRSLEPHEIVAQWFAATHTIGIRPRNVVFMGMGEPMDNIENVIQAISILGDHNGPALAKSRITVSTVGRVDGIRRLAEQVRQPGWHRLGLAISVNAPSDEVRSGLMPINRKWNMRELREALLEWPKYGGTALCIEYVLIPGVNDAAEHAEQLAEYVRPLRACVNIIPYNPRRDSPWPAPQESDVERFLAALTARGIYCKRRRTKGRDLMGACGQLGNPQVRRRKLVDVTIS